MIDSVHPAASWYLWILSIGFVALFALPLLLFPLHWARWFKWRVADDDNLALYFGRCLGGVALALSVGWFRAAMHPGAYPIVWEITIAAGALMTWVHILGALQKRQPWTETAEIGMYGLLTVAAYLIYRSL